ncbi:MAG: hypothetical protein NC033_03650 [Clostridiales bacterium]|nr:hypothetical protein [Clostridiales bacterium]
MEFDKEEDVLGSLYALRGGLSAISAEYVRVRKADAEYHEELNTVADQAGGARYEAPKGTVEYAMWICNGGFDDELHRRYNQIQEKEIEDKSADYEDKIIDAHKNAVKKFVAMAVLILITGIILAALYFGIMLVEYDGKKGFDAILNINGYLILTGMCLCPPLAMLIASLVSMYQGIRYACSINRLKRELQEYQLKLQREIDEEHNRAETARKAIREYFKFLPQVKEEAREILGERNSVVKSSVKNCNAYYKALVAEFSPILDLRDWQHLDLVIYEIETRRADSIKEALQLVDRELQTERLERTMSEAAKSVCYTLQHGFRNLQHTIRSCCEEISDRLGAMSAQLESINNSVNIGNALQAQSNKMVAELLSNAQAVLVYD